MFDCIILCLTCLAKKLQSKKVTNLGTYLQIISQRAYINDASKNSGVKDQKPNWKIGKRYKEVIIIKK